VSPLKELKWSNELALAAQAYLESLEGCTTNIDQINDNQNTKHEELEKIATFLDHERIIFYPRRQAWNNPAEVVFDWIMDDEHVRGTVMPTLIKFVSLTLDSM